MWDIYQDNWTYNFKNAIKEKPSGIVLDLK